jgi:hypothetical protein
MTDAAMLLLLRRPVKNVTFCTFVKIRELTTSENGAGYSESFATGRTS